MQMVWKGNMEGKPGYIVICEHYSVTILTISSVMDKFRYPAL